MSEEMPIKRQPPIPRGRLPGTKLKYSKDSVRKLAQLGFDPIVQMVNTHRQTDIEFKKLTTNKDGSPKLRADGKPDYSMMTAASLLLVKQKVENDLLRYRYPRVTEVGFEGDDDAPPPPMIVLHGPDDVYTPPEIEVGDDDLHEGNTFSEDGQLEIQE
jgi:hypothetical protein